MATHSDAMAVKSLNTSGGRRRFAFKSISRKLEEIDVDVYRSLDPLKAEPSEGSSFFRDSLAEYRELNTAEDFISFYEEIFPLVQTLPQIILQKDLIISSLVSRLKMEGRLSHEPILRLIAALSRDLLGDFIPFLPKIAESLESILISGAEKDPETIEQILTSWSYIMMYLQKYLVGDVGHVLRITRKLRYYRKDYIQELMAESISLLLRKAPVQQLKKGIMKLMTEVVEEPSEMRKFGAGALISHAIRISSSKLHSKAEILLPVLVDNSTFQIGGQNEEGSRDILEVLILAFKRLYAELDHVELTFIWKWLCGRITDSVTISNSRYLNHLLTLLISVVQNGHMGEVSDYKALVELVDLLVQTFVNPYLATKDVDPHPEVIDSVLQLIICVIDVLSKNTPALVQVASQWESVFDLRSRSLLKFIEDLLTKDPSIYNIFGMHIMRALNNLVEKLHEEVLYIMIKFSEKLEGMDSNLLDVSSMENLKKIHLFSEETLQYWIAKINEATKGNLVPSQFQQSSLAVLWGVSQCYSRFARAQADPSLSMDLINAIDELLMMDSSYLQNTWHSLIGAALRSYHKIAFQGNYAQEEAALTKFLVLARRYKLSPQILSAVADILDSISGSFVPSDRKYQFYLQEHIAGKVLDALDIFAENLSHANKEIRLSTLRILCYYEPIHYKQSVEKIPAENDARTDDTENVDEVPNNVLNLLKSIEETSLSTTSRKEILLISKMQMNLSAQRIAGQYIPVVLNGVIGIFHNRLSSSHKPALKCLSILIGQYSRMVWSRYVKYLENCQSVFLTSHHQQRGSDSDSNKDTGLVGLFNSASFPVFDSTPHATVLSLLIRSLRKVPSIAQTHSQQIVPLFLQFLGYSPDETSNVAAHTLDHKGKNWKEVLKEWLRLFELLRNPEALHRSLFLKEVLQYRLLDQNDADVQLKVLDCLLNWRDDFLLPYSVNLKKLIDAKCLREEITKWSLSRKCTDAIDVRHRAYLVPIVIRVLIPKVRNLKMLSCQKSAGVSHRRAVLEFLAQLDVDELPLFFWLLIKPLLSVSQRDDETGKSFLSLSQGPKDEIDISYILKHFTTDSVKALTWKKKYGFLHVIEDILAVFDESHLDRFLNLLMNCVVRILASCTSSIVTRSSGLSSTDTCSSMDLDADDHDEVEVQTMERMAVKQFRDMRSLCLKIIYLVLGKYESHEFDGAFWDLFFVSVKPLIANFKQEGASSHKPSSLFDCFLAMSKNYKLVPLLYRERNLVPDIFSMLTIPSASEWIVSGVLEFTKNLLELDSELGSEDITVRRVLLPHLDVLISSLHTIFTNDNATRRQFASFPGKREFTIFNLLSKYVKEPSTAKTFVDILLPLLTTRRQNFDTCVDVLQIVREVVTVLESGISKKIINSITPLLISAGLSVRNSICDVLDAVAANDSSVLILAKILRELNATSEMEMDGLDYDKIICAYEKVNVEFFYTIREEHVLPILAHSVHGMSSEESTIRNCAFGLLKSFIVFSGEVLSGSSKFDHLWSEASIHHIVKTFLLKHMGSAMDKEGAVKKVWFDLLQEMVLKLPNVANLDSFRALCSDDAEQDFFGNIVHLQKHRRAKAVRRLKSCVCSGTLSEDITNKVFVPLLFSMLFGAESGKDENIISACLEALGSISGCLKWNGYYALLLRCFRDLQLKQDKQKILLRLICEILDHFHFSESSLVHEAKVGCDAPDPYNIGMASSLTLRKCTSSAELPIIQMTLHKNLFPKIQKLLASDSDKVNVIISLVALKLLKLLPGEILDSQLPTIVHRISNFLKHRLESVRNEARSALAVCLKELGIGYLQFIVKVMKSTLKRGYELHVLGYTLNFLLSNFPLNQISGKVDYCLDELLSVVENDVLGDISEEKEVEKIASKMKETRKQKSFDTLKMISQSITFKSHALRLLSPVTVHMQKQLTQKVKLKLENMLNSIASGIEHNPSVNQTELLVFVNCLIKDGIRDDGDEYGNSGASRTGRLVNVDQRFSHLITAFALGVLQNHMKKLNLKGGDEQLLSLLDPFVNLLCQCLSSKYENITIAALRCLTLLVRFPLPSLQSQADNIKSSLFVIAQSSVNSRSQLTESCITTLTMLLRSTRVTLSADQLHMLIQFPLFVDFAKNPSHVALSLLKAIVQRKLVVPEIYDIVQIVAELMVQSQLEPVRKKCSKILLQFLLGYHLSEKRLQQHLDFLLANLRYEHSSGREAVLEMLHAIIKKFPLNVVDAQAQTMFVHLVISLANDDDSKVRSMSAAAIKCLIEHVSKHSRHSILEYCLSWYLGGKQNLWGTAAQVLGLLVEVMGKSFKKHLCRVVPVMRTIFQSAVNAITSNQQSPSDEAVLPFWKEAYYSLVMLEKILSHFHSMFFHKDLEDIWQTICEFLLHPHLWLRSISNRILSDYFDAVTKACQDKREVSMGTFFLMKPSILFHVAASSCHQLKVPPADDKAGDIVKRNLEFSICALHSFLERNDCIDMPEFWSNLDQVEQDRFLKAFVVLDPSKGRRTLSSFTSEASGQHNQHHHPLISFLLQRMGKISIQMEDTQMKIVFNCLKEISPKLLGGYKTFSPTGNDDLHSYAYPMLLPLYRICEGYTGQVISDDLKQLAKKVSESIRDVIGVPHFVQVYSQIRKNLKVKRDKRKQGEKIMAVVNPERNAKRKLRIADKHRAHKKRKIMTMKVGRWKR